jgi:hypothetical protein
MQHAQRLILVLGLAAALLHPVGTALAAGPNDDHLEIVSLTTLAPADVNSADIIPFQVVVTYRLQSASSGFLLLFLFENAEAASTRQSSTAVPVQSGGGQLSMNIDWTIKPGVRTLSLMIALFKSDQKLLTWISTTPIDLAPWPGRAAFDKAMAARLAANYESADTYLSAAIQTSPDIGNYYYWRGDTRIYLNRYDAAVEDFSHSIALMPEDRASRVGRGIGLLWRGDAQLALADLTFAIDRSRGPDRLTAFAYRARGTANALLSRPVEAISDYQAYLTLMPDASDRDEVEAWIADLS